VPEPNEDKFDLDQLNMIIIIITFIFFLNIRKRYPKIGKMSKIMLVTNYNKIILAGYLSRPFLI
jgi:hypothetical protein